MSGQSFGSQDQVSWWDPDAQSPFNVGLTLGRESWMCQHGNVITLGRQLFKGDPTLHGFAAWLRVAKPHTSHIGALFEPVGSEPDHGTHEKGRRSSSSMEKRLLHA